MPIRLGRYPQFVILRLGESGTGTPPQCLCATLHRYRYTSKSGLMCATAPNTGIPKLFKKDEFEIPRVSKLAKKPDPFIGVKK